MRLATLTLVPMSQKNIPTAVLLLFCLPSVTAAVAHLTYCSFPAVQLTGAALEAHYYHIIYESWPCGMQLEHEYQLSSGAAASFTVPTYVRLSARAQVYGLPGHRA